MRCKWDAQLPYYLSLQQPPEDKSHNYPFLSRILGQKPYHLSFISREDTSTDDSLASYVSADVVAEEEREIWT
jgi:hypothetical protein